MCYLSVARLIDAPLCISRVKDAQQEPAGVNPVLRCYHPQGMEATRLVISEGFRYSKESRACVVNMAGAADAVRPKLSMS